MKVEHYFYYAQKVNDGYTFGTVTYTYLMMPQLSPSDLDNDPALDIEEKTGIVDTAETLQIDKVWLWLPEFYQGYKIENNYLTKGIGRFTIALSVAGDGTYATTLSKVTVDIGYVDEAGAFTSKGSADATPNVSQTPTTYLDFSGQCFIDITETSITRYAMFAVRTRVYAYVASGSTGGKIKIRCTRGSTDTYLEFPIALSEYQP